VIHLPASRAGSTSIPTHKEIWNGVFLAVEIIETQPNILEDGHRGDRIILPFALAKLVNWR
jgi:hypothetical protein